ncbi:hybrid signal transduction histidine kinase L [Strongylocentrotus purpuratus]|uniref:Uncharacterized protein n=1 Tax=Strongylocentrotus purpuratus TaxID=7668 RepID=A0A7M7LT83_STRPU|nr:hybrid signal transduction histidine kinase L [Strongylocentrotus purpuratus]
MGQVCPASAPSQQYVPTNCQGVSTNTTNEKRKIETSQPCVDSRLISRGASCTQDDIRRSLRKEKEIHITSPRCTTTCEGNRDDERLHSKHRHSSRSLQNQSIGRHRPGTQDSFRKKEEKDKDRGGSIPSKHHQRYKQEQDDAFQVSRDERSHHHETQRGHHYHQTHVLHQKGSKLHVESQLVTKQQVHRREHHQQHHHRQHHRKMDRKEDEWKHAEVHRQEHQKSKLSSHVEYSSQNEHNAQISARKTHLPNNTQSARSSQKSQKERCNRMEAAGSARSSLKEKRTKQNDVKEISAKEGEKKLQRMRKMEDPVYSLPPIMK